MLDVNGLFAGNLQGMGVGAGGLPVGVSSLTGGMAAQEQSAGMANNQLNQQSQDIANQAAQEALKQAQIQTPLQQAKATQDIQTAQQATAAGAQYGPEALASAAQQTIAKNYTGKTVTEREQHESQMKDIIEAKNLVTDPNFDWSNKDHVKMAEGVLHRNDLADVPDLTQDHLPQIKALAGMATQSLEMTRQMKLGESSHGYSMELEKLKGSQTYSTELMKKIMDVSIASGAADKAMAMAVMGKPADERAKLRLEESLRIKPDGTGGWTQQDLTTAEGLAAKELATAPEMAQIKEISEKNFNNYRMFDLNTIKQMALSNKDHPFTIPTSITDPTQAAIWLKTASENAAKDNLIQQVVRRTWPGGAEQASKNGDNPASPPSPRSVRGTAFQVPGQGNPQTPPQPTPMPPNFAAGAPQGKVPSFDPQRGWGYSLPKDAQQPPTPTKSSTAPVAASTPPTDNSGWGTQTSGFGGSDSSKTIPPPPPVHLGKSQAINPAYKDWQSKGYNIDDYQKQQDAVVAAQVASSKKRPVGGTTSGKPWYQQ